MACVYILYSSRMDKYYVGATKKSAGERLEEHNRGATTFTKSGKPWILMYSEYHDQYKEALRRERQIKSWKSRQAILNLINLTDESDPIPSGR
jgi:putative endonuclease